MRSDIKNILVNALFGFSICIVVGLLFYGTVIFNIKDSRSQLLLVGFYGAIFYSVFKYGNFKETVFVGLIIFVSYMVLQGNTLTLNYFIRDIVFFSSIFGSLILYKIFIDRYSKLPLFFRGFALSIILGLLNVISTLLLSLIFNPSLVKMNIAIFLNAQYAALIGIGLGIGFDLFEIYQDKMFPQKKAKVL